MRFLLWWRAWVCPRLGNCRNDMPPAPAVLFFSLTRRSAMSVRPDQNSRPRRCPEPLRVTHPHAAGIDIHAGIHWVAVPPGDAPPAPDHAPHLLAHVRSFGTCTADLIALADWLSRCGVTTVAMESTGIYWIPLFELLGSRGFEV